MSALSSLLLVETGLYEILTKLQHYWTAGARAAAAAKEIHIGGAAVFSMPGGRCVGRTEAGESTMRVERKYRFSWFVP